MAWSTLAEVDEQPYRPHLLLLKCSMADTKLWTERKHIRQELFLI